MPQEVVVAGAPLTTRVAQWLEAELKEEFSRRGEGPSEGLRRVIEEWWVHKHLPAIEWREGVTGSRPAIRGGPEIWEVVMVAREGGGGLEPPAGHFDWVSREELRQALAFYRLFPGDIDRHLQENERIERQLREEGA